MPLYDRKPLCALVVGGSEAGHTSLERIFYKVGWKLFRACNRREALDKVASHAIPIVITESDVAEGGWRGILADLMELREPPLLLVTSRLADDALWAEVLNMGGFDVLAEPLDAEEVTRVVGAAQRHFDNALEWARHYPKPLVMSAS